MVLITAVGIYFVYICSVNGGEALRVNMSEYDNTAYCTSYCDVYGYYQPAKWCVSEDPTVEVYCCGGQHDRYCCSDDEKDVGDMYDPVKSCPNSSWWHNQWKVIIGLLGTLVVMLMFAACCYYCCGGDTRLPSRSRFTRRRRARTDQGPGSSPNGENNLSFDPASPNAFTPPDYDSLPKDPPKYADIFNSDQGVTNLGCTSTGTDPESVPTIIVPPGPPEYTPAVVVAIEDNTTTSTETDRNVNDNAATQPQTCDSVPLDVPDVTVSRSSSSHSLNETHVTSDSSLLSESANQSNTQEGASHTDVQCRLVEDTQTSNSANQMQAAGATIASITIEAQSVRETTQVTPSATCLTEEVQHM